MAPTTVYLRAERNIDKVIDLARFGARKDKVTVVIQRTITTRRGDIKQVPLLEVTPTGDVQEIMAHPLRASITARLTEADLDYRDAGMNKRAAAGHEHFARLVKLSRDYMAAEREHEQNRRLRRRHNRDARRNANTAVLLDTPRKAAA